MTNALYYGDNLDVLHESSADASVDLIYLDPPFNSQANYNVLFKSPTGKAADAQMIAVVEREKAAVSDARNARPDALEQFGQGDDLDFRHLPALRVIHMIDRPRRQPRHTGAGRCPWLTWVPAFAGKAMR